MKLFIDTGAFIALTDMSDENHQAANNFYMKVKEKGIKLVTTNFVVCETMNYLRAKVSHDVAVAFREGFRKSSLFEIITPVNIDTAIADKTGEYLRKFGKTHALNIGDAIIAATASEMKLTLATRNVKHYPMKDIIVLKPY